MTPLFSARKTGKDGTICLKIMRRLTTAYGTLWLKAQRGDVCSVNAVENLMKFSYRRRLDVLGKLFIKVS
jgi:hypothetical protein